MNKPNARINVRTIVNAREIREETRDGRKVVIVPSATLPDDVVMNGVFYPADEIEKGYKSLERTPAPLGHPSINGKFVSASDPVGMVRGFIGAWNENVRRENGRVFIDKVIDIEYANQTDGGKRVIEAIANGKPIHTSTGLLAQLVPIENAEDGPEWMATDLFFDHDAILLDEQGAATPDQGVGMLVNSAADAAGNEIRLINSALDDAERELEWAAEYALRAAEKLEKVPMMERLKQLIKDAVRGKAETETQTNEEDEQGMDKAQFDQLSNSVQAVAEAQKDLPQVIANAIAEALKPVTENLANQQAQAAAAAEAEKNELVNKVVEAKILTVELANASSVEVLKALAGTIAAPKAAYRLNSAAPAAATANNDSFVLPKSE